MAIFKCKMCGGTLEFSEGATVGVCDSCGTKQTLPRAADDLTANLFNRANNLRLKCEFDKAAALYEKIVEQDDANAEAHWGIVLCKYGIEYVEDPKTHTRVPTCHRTLYEAVSTDADYLAAVDYGDAAQQTLYENEARAIDRIQKNILSIVKNEKPFDVFLCYKETDENGKRTVDSALANDIYYQLTGEGFKVFFSAITLEDKLGQEYEPYIFAALHSARVMLAIGTKPEYFSSVWVKNEWSRFLALMKTDRSKLLIPCYRDMNPYDLPEEFAHLQAQDMGKIGFINDLSRGIKKVCSSGSGKAPVRETVVVPAGNVNTAPLLKRAFLFLEDGEWDEADAYCEKVLDQDPENAQAYLGKLMAELRVHREEDLADCEQPFDGSNNYQKAVRFGGEKVAAALGGYLTHIVERNEQARVTELYNKALFTMETAKSETDYKTAAELFGYLEDYLDSPVRAAQCLEKAEICRKDGIYQYARQAMNTTYRYATDELEQALSLFQKIPGYRDADDLAETCKSRILEIRESLRRQQANAAERAKRQRRIALIGITVIAICLIGAILLMNSNKSKSVETQPAAETEDNPTSSASLNLNQRDLPRVVDRAALLTDEEEADLAARIAELTETWGLDIVLLTNATGYGGKSAAAFSDDYYDEHGYGAGSDSSGIILLVDMQERELYLSTCGKAIYVFTDYGINQLYNAVVSYFSSGDYAGGFRRFLREIPDYAAAYEQGAPIDLKT